MVAIALIALVMVPVRSFAQVSGSISGTVLDPSNAAVPAAKVMLVDEETKVNRDTDTNGSGYFAFAGVTPGTYDLEVKAKDFKTWKQTGIAIHVGDVRTLPNISLTVGAAAEVVEVNATVSTLVPVDSGAQEDILSHRDIEDLPIESRNITELIKVLPGVSNQNGGIGNGAGYMGFLNVGSNGSTVGVGLSINGAPYRGGTSLLSDGANIIDAGCNCWGLSTIEPRLTQEVQVEMSNFGADVQKGPVVINTIGKSGTKEYHGSLWFDARNDALNANDWVDNSQGNAKGTAHYYYPGGDFGGPVPFTRKKIYFWFGYDHFLQNTGSSGSLESFIPSQGMQNGIFNSTDAGTAALCPNLNAVGNDTSATPLSGVACASINGMILPDGTTVTNGVIPSAYLDKGAAALAKSVWPAPTATTASAISALGGNNYFQTFPSIHDGYIYRMRFDYDLNDSNKFFVSYQYGTDTALANGTGAHVWYNPGNAVPFPGGGISGLAQDATATAHFIHVFSPSVTNEFVAAWGWQNSPQNASLGQVQLGPTSMGGTGYTYASVFNSSTIHMIPSFNSAGNHTFPDFSEPDLFEGGGWATKKQNPSFADNFTKVWRTHTIKIGGFWETVGNLQGGYNFANGLFSYGGQNPNYVNTTITHSGFQGLIGSATNPTADFLTGIASGFSQTNYEPYEDMAYHTLSGYIDDSWRMTKRFTLEVGLRFDHMGRWYDRSAVNGEAAFFPNLVAPDVAAGRALAGVRWHGVDPGVGLGGSPVRKVFTSPRFGFAYDVFGTGKTVLRGGWGRYRWNDQVNDYLGALTIAQNLITYNLPGGENVQMNQLGLIAPPTSGTLNYASGATNGSINADDGTDYEMPYTDSFNFTISQQVIAKTLFQIAFVGNRSGSILMGGQNIGYSTGGDLINRNVMPLGALFGPDPVTGLTMRNPENFSYGCTNAAHVNVSCGASKYADFDPFGMAYGTNSISVVEHTGWANYNSLQVSWIKPAGNLVYTLNYTWSKSLGTSLGINPYSVGANYGELNIERPHVINMSASYRFPVYFHTDSAFVKGLLSDWMVSTFVTWQAGTDEAAPNNYSPNLGYSENYYCAKTAGGVDVEPGCDASLATFGSSIGSPTYFGTKASMDIIPSVLCNPTANLAANHAASLACFGVPAVGSGQAIRGVPFIAGPVFWDSDLAVSKTVHITERQSVEFKASANNWLNHPLVSFSGSNQLQVVFQKEFITGAVISTPKSSTWGTYDTKVGQPNQRILMLSATYRF